MDERTTAEDVLESTADIGSDDPAELEAGAATLGVGTPELEAGAATLSVETSDAEAAPPSAGTAEEPADLDEVLAATADALAEQAARPAAGAQAPPSAADADRIAREVLGVAEEPPAPAPKKAPRKPPPAPVGDEEPSAEDLAAAEAAAEAERIEAAIPPGAEWYVIHTYAGYEGKVKRNLEHRIESMGMLDQIFQVVVPVEEEVDIKDGQRRIVERKIFPGYVLVRMLLNEESWSVVRNTPAVTGFVGSGTQPTALRREEVDKILRRMESEEPTIRVSFRPGQNVRIVDGPFTDFHGVVDDIDLDRGKVRLMVNFFGRETPVELDFLQVEKV